MNNSSKNLNNKILIGSYRVISGYQIRKFDNVGVAIEIFPFLFGKTIVENVDVYSVPSA